MKLRFLDIVDAALTEVCLNALGYELCDYNFTLDDESNMFAVCDFRSTKETLSENSEIDLHLLIEVGEAKSKLWDAIIAYRILFEGSKRNGVVGDSEAETVWLDFIGEKGILNANGLKDRFCFRDEQDALKCLYILKEVFASTGHIPLPTFFGLRQPEEIFARYKKSEDKWRALFGSIVSLND